MKGMFFTLDAALALFFLTLVFSSYGYVDLLQSISLDTTPKLVGQDVLNTMEKMGFLAEIANGQRSQADIENFLQQLTPAQLASNFSITTYRASGASFEQVLQINGSTGVFSAPFATTRRVTVVPGNNEDLYLSAQLTVGFR